MPTHFASSGTPPARRGRPRAYDVRELLTVGLGTRSVVCRAAVFISYIFLHYAKKRSVCGSIGDRLCILLYVRIMMSVQ